MATGAVTKILCGLRVPGHECQDIQAQKDTWNDWMTDWWCAGAALRSAQFDIDWVMCDLLCAAAGKNGRWYQFADILPYFPGN